MHITIKSNPKGILSLIKNQVFDTCLKSDEQQEVAGQNTNHGGLSLCH